MIKMNSKTKWITSEVNINFFMKGYQETVQMVSKVLTILYRKLDKQGLRLYVHSPDGMKNDHRLLDQDCSTADRLSKTLPRLRL